VGVAHGIRDPVPPSECIVTVGLSSTTSDPKSLGDFAEKTSIKKTLFIKGLIVVALFMNIHHPFQIKYMRTFYTRSRYSEADL
jgi:hypothetical protein